MATQEQKDQFIARIATGLKLGFLDKYRFQAFLGDPEALDRFADEFIATYERRSYPPVTIDFTEPTLPDWSKGRVLNGIIRRWKEIDLMSVMARAWFHPRQIGDEHEDNRPSGHEILTSLVASYKPDEDKNGNIYDVSETDLIHDHFGLAEAIYMRDHWRALPNPFKVWSKGKRLYGWRDVVRGDDDNLFVSCLDCEDDQPLMSWYDLKDLWKTCEPALRGQVGTQG